MNRIKGRLHLTMIAAAMLSTVSCWAASESARNAAIPFEVIADAARPQWRATFDLSPSRRYAAHIVYLPNTGAAAAKPGTATKIRVIDMRTGATRLLGPDAGSAWAPVWSPDGKTLAYFAADADGEAGLWTWSSAAGASARLPGVVVHYQDHRETAHWTRDGRKLLCKVRSLTATPMQNSARAAPAAAPPAGESRGNTTGGNTTAVTVRRTSEPAATETKPATDATAATTAQADVAIVDLHTHTVNRIGSTNSGAWVGLSPDDTQVAYPVPPGPDGKFNLALVDVEGGARRNIELPNDGARGYGWSWSPDGARIAYRFWEAHQDPDAPPQGEVSIVSLPDGKVSRLGGPQFIASNNDNTLLWDPSGVRVFVVGSNAPFRDYQDWRERHQDRVWEFDVRSGQLRSAAVVANQSITSMVGVRERPLAWSMDDGRSLWVFTEARAAGKDRRNAGLYRVKLGSGKAEHMLWADAGEAESSVGDKRSGEVQFDGGDGFAPNEVWLFDTKTRHKRRVTSMGAEMASYQPGELRTLDYRHPDGRKLEATLLLPPGSDDERSPLVVWVWGYEHSSPFIYRPPLPSNNPLALSSRGYAVLFPDMPRSLDRPMRDIRDTVRLGVDAAIATGRVDPQRLAVIGYSWGSYCVLSVITQSDRFKAAIVSGVSVPPDPTFGYMLNLISGRGKVQSPYEQRSTPGAMAATPWSHPDRFLENSPFFAFDRIATPLLIGQGSGDGLFVTDLVYGALARLGKSAELRVYDDDHPISKRENVIDFWQAKVRFLDEHLNVSRDGSGRMLLHDRLSSAGAEGERP